MTRLAVEQAELVNLGGPLPSATRSARLEWRQRRGVAVRLAAGGLVGWGECSPLPGVSRDLLDDGVTALGRLLAGELPRLELDDPFRDITDWVARIPAELPAARFALDTALLDLCAQAYACGVAHILGDGTAPVPASTLIDLDHWRDEVPGALAAGLATFKLKVGRPGHLDRELAELRELRAAHPDVALRLDLNGVLGSREADEVLPRLAEIGPEWVEQPVPPGLLSDLAPPPCPIAADESVSADDDDMWRAVHRGIVTVAVIKPAMVGGVQRALALAERAATLDLDVVVSHLLDGPIALAMCAELAVALGGGRAAGLGPHPGLAAYPNVAVPQLVAGWLRSIGPGLGVAIE